MCGVRKHFGCAAPGLCQACLYNASSFLLVLVTVFWPHEPWWAGTHIADAGAVHLASFLRGLLLGFEPILVESHRQSFQLSSFPAR